VASSTPYAAERRSNAAGLIWPSVECRRRWLQGRFRLRIVLEVLSLLAFDGREETLDDGVVVTVATAAHDPVPR
jgi:hypothetical protein